MVLFPNCKINLGLHILRKREDGYHDLQTVFYPLPIHDALEVISKDDRSGETELQVTGNSIDVPMERNICYKAWKLLQERFPSIPAVKMHLHKTIPSGAGLGGGSADGAFTLLLLNRKYNLGLSESELIELALMLGSDCPFFVINKPAIGSGRGEHLLPIELDLSAYQVIVVNPGIHVATGWAFSQLKPVEDREDLSSIISLPVDQWKGRLVNDFEAAIFRAYPPIALVAEQFYAAGAVYASMSGSGSTVFGIFPKEAKPDLSFPAHYFMKTV